MSLSITNSLTLRLYYGSNYSTYATKANRSDATAGTLSFADATALRNAIRNLPDYDWEEGSDDDVQAKLQAFADAMNATLDSAAEAGSSNTYVKNAASKIKSLNSQYSSELANIGITVNDDGSVSLSSSAAETYSHSKFKSFFDEDNEYLNEIYTQASKIRKKVDVRV